MIPSKTLHNVRDMVDLIENTSIEILKEKRDALEKGGEEAMKDLTAGGKDIISILRGSLFYI